MNLHRIWAVFRKDLRDALRDSRVLIAVLLPLGLGLLYNVMFQDTPTVPTVTVAYVASDATALPNRLQATLASSAKVNLMREPTADAARTAISKQQADLALLIPAGFDAAVARGETPSLSVLRSSSSSTGAAMVLSILNGVLAQMAGQHPPATVSIQTVAASQVGIETIIQQVGLRPYFALASTMMIVGMITMLALPIVLGEEREKKTLDALVMVASYPEVIVAKALLGVVYTVIAVPLLLALTRIAPLHLATFATSLALLCVTLIGFGLLLGALLTANQMNTWGSLFLLPIILPPFFLGMALPGALQSVILVLPSTHAMQLILNSMASRPFYPNAWISYLVIAAWGVIAYALLLWQLSRRAE